MVQVQCADDVVHSSSDGTFGGGLRKGGLGGGILHLDTPLDQLELAGVELYLVNPRAAGISHAPALGMG